jgi:monomeric isocitrate dehydrogenase
LANQVVRDSGMMWNKDDALEDVKCIIPDRCYATIYQKVTECSLKLTECSLQAI